jgi:GNAT superfamily N-acetyltransferase
MPYHRRWRTECNTGRRDPGVAVEHLARHPARSRRRRCEPARSRSAKDANHIAPADPHEVLSTRVEYLIRPARVTDIERLVALSGGSVRAPGRTGPMDSGDLLRQLVYLPQASIFIAEARREVVGGAVLALRPSVRAGGFVGTVDLIVVDPDHDQDRVTDALLEEILRSARNKGCTVVEAALSDDPAMRTRLERHGFVEAGPRAERPVAAVGAPTGRTGN